MNHAYYSVYIFIFFSRIVASVYRKRNFCLTVYRETSIKTQTRAVVSGNFSGRAYALAYAPRTDKW